VTKDANAWLMGEGAAGMAPQWQQPKAGRYLQRLALGG
jgi:hypothetical protein